MKMDNNYNNRPRVHNRLHRRVRSNKDQGSQTYSSSDEDFHSDDNLRPYEEVKIALHDKKLSGLGLTPNEHAVSPLEHTRPLLQPNAMQGHMDDLDNHVEAMNRLSLVLRQNQIGSHGSVSSDELAEMIQSQTGRSNGSHLCNCYEEHRCKQVNPYHTGTLPIPVPPPTLPPPPPPPPPIEDIPQRTPQTPQRQKAFGPSTRGNYSETENTATLRRPTCMSNTSSPCNNCSESESEFEPHYLSQTPSGNVFMSLSGVPVDQHRFPRTVPRAGTLPMNRATDLPSPQGRPMCSESFPRHFPNGEQPCLQQNNCQFDRTVVGYPPYSANTTIPALQPHNHSDCGYYSKFSTAGHRVKKQLQRTSTWRCLTLILLLLCVAFLAGVVYFAVIDKKEDIELTTQATTTALPSTSFHLGQNLSHQIPPKSFWFSEFEQLKPHFVKLNFSFPSSAILVIYGRRNVPPTHAQFDFSEIIDGRRIHRQKRSLDKQGDVDHGSRDTAILQHLNFGKWFLGIYNDNEETQVVSFASSKHDADESLDLCPNNCHGHGVCKEGICQCFSGFTGDDCSQKPCPILCSGNGAYQRGVCNCHRGWKGRECELRDTECEVPNCNGNGQCENGVCNCQPGFQGPDCGIVDCVPSNCSGNGYCVLGKCLCSKGFKGDNCSEPDTLNFTQVCSNSCSGHGTFNIITGTCQCDRHFVGKNCETEVCRLECIHGTCKNQGCICDKGWSGAVCDQVACDHRCDANGFCNNGTCVCKNGWNGKHCTLEGCPKSCNKHGACKKNIDVWSCRCREGWKGKDCGVAKEMNCHDQQDNDGDGLKDCLDPDCCVAASCKGSSSCETAPNPLEILLGKQAPSTTASFFDKMRFLIEQKSVQMYATRSAFNESLVSVIRGKVQALDGTPLIGVRIGVVTQPLYGFTYSREGGLFDLLVNGGGSVTLELHRQPFKIHTASVLVPWNQFITMDTVIMVTDKDEVEIPDPSFCTTEHKHYWLKPVVLSTWQHTQLGACPEKSTVIPESQVLQESLAIPGTNVHLVYHSSESAGYMSVIMIQMTPATIPEDLSLVHVRVSVEGIVTEKLFEADPNLKYTFAWDRKNAYNQKVYGIVTARVYVGYQYIGCDYIFWETRSTTMSGYDITSSEIGGWNLDFHHTYNFQEGILHKGDGTNIYLKEKPKKIVNILGNGLQRKLNCELCNGKAVNNKLHSPVALASGLDGSIYVGDYNFIRKLAPNRDDIASILELSTQLTAYKFHMTVSPVDGRLYISDYMSHRIIRVKTMGPVRDLHDNFEDIAGNGDECTPGELDMCGDGGKATAARLRHPKGIAINKDGVIYLADGPNIRMISTDGIITTLIGSQGQLKKYTPMPCDDILSADEISLQWPTSLAIDPLDDTLHILDSNIVLKLTKDRKLVTVAGRAFHCPPKRTSFFPAGVLSDNDQASSIADHVILVSPESITFGPHGDLYIVESDQHHINRVRVVTTDGRIHHFAGAKSKCDCKTSTCKCYDMKESLAAQALFSTLTSITVTPDGVLHIADMGNLRVSSIVSELPQPNLYGQFEVVSPETQELYIFNYYGQHQHTLNIMTNQYLYNLTYNVKSYYGKLITVTDSAGNDIKINRAYDTEAKEIIGPDGSKCQLVMDNIRRLYKFLPPDKSSAIFTYSTSKGLLRTKQLSDGKMYTYDYDRMGRLLQVSQPTGEITSLVTDVNTTGSIVHVTTDKQDAVAMATYGSVQSVMHEPTILRSISSAAETKVTYLPDGAVVVVFPNNLTIAVESGGHPIMENEHRMHFKRKLIAPNAHVHKLEWRFYLRRKGRTKQSKIIERVGNRLRVGSQFSRHDRVHESHDQGYKEKALLINGENLLTIEYDRETHTESVLDKDLKEVMTVIYNDAGLPVNFIPARDHVGMNITYAKNGEISAWQYGELREERVYNEKGRVVEKRLTNGALYRYIYRHGRKPTDIFLPSGKQFLFKYDKHGNIIELTAPELGKHKFYNLMSLGFQRFLYLPPGLTQPFIEDYDGNGKLLRILYPSEQKRVVYQYDMHSKLVSVLYDETEIKINYDEAIQMKSSAELISRGYSCLQTYQYSSALVSQYDMQFLQDHRLLGATFKYQYDDNFRLTKVDTLLTNNLSAESNSSYNKDTGKLESIKDFKFVRALQDREMIQDEKIMVLRDYDEYGRIKHVQYKFKEAVRFMMQVTYDKNDRIQQWRRRVGQTDSSTIEYIYDVDSNIVKLNIDNKLAWNFKYDANGNIKLMTHYGVTKHLSYDSGDRILRFDEDWYKFDDDGFVIQRDRDLLKFNSLGLLTLINRVNKYKFAYYYDTDGRLVVQRDKFGNIMQFYYGNILKKWQVTHTFNHTSRELTQYLYDDQDHLLAMERKGVRLYIATDPMGSPIVIFNSEGFVVKQITYNVLGYVKSDSNAKFEFCFGFQGGIYNSKTNLVHFTRRIYDTLIGRWLTPDYDMMFAKLKNILDHPGSFNLYKFQELVNVHTRNQFHPMTDLSSWLSVLGIDVNSLAPDVSYDGVIRPEKPVFDHQLLPSSSAFECTFHRDMNKLLSISTVPQSKITPKQTSIITVPTQVPSILGEGVTLSVIDGIVHVRVLDTASDWSKKFGSILLNNSEALDLQFTIHGRDVHYFVKSDPSQADDDLRNLGIYTTEATLGDIRVDVHRVKHTDGFRLRSHSEIDIRLHGNHTVINVRYGSTIEHERRRVLRHAKERAVQQAWDRERHLLQNKLPTFHHWTDKEKREIIKAGYADGYDARYIRNPEDYPSLADDCNNISFVKGKR